MLIRCFLVIIFVVLSGVGFSEAKNIECAPIESEPIKIEIWLSKRYESELRKLRKEFIEVGNTRANLWIYPAENPSKTVAIGRCVPAYIAHHTLRKAVEYFDNVNALVNQGFFSSNWIGIGTSLFSENSLQTISSDELAELMDSSLDTGQFQSLYRRITLQDKKVKAFGLLLNNPKLLKDY